MFFTGAKTTRHATLPCILKSQQFLKAAEKKVIRAGFMVDLGIMRRSNLNSDLPCLGGTYTECKMLRGENPDPHTRRRKHKPQRQKPVLMPLRQMPCLHAVLCQRGHTEGKAGQQLKQIPWPFRCSETRCQGQIHQHQMLGLRHVGSQACQSQRRVQMALSPNIPKIYTLLHYSSLHFLFHCPYIFRNVTPICTPRQNKLHHLLAMSWQSARQSPFGVIHVPTLYTMCRTHHSETAASISFICLRV